MNSIQILACIFVPFDPLVLKADVCTYSTCIDLCTYNSMVILHTLSLCTLGMHSLGSILNYVFHYNVCNILHACFLH